MKCGPQPGKVWTGPANDGLVRCKAVVLFSSLWSPSVFPKQEGVFHPGLRRRNNLHKPTVKRIRVLIVDDSSFVRKALFRIFDKDPSIEVVGMAISGKEAVEKVLSLAPDVLTLDIIMPGMDGLETLKIIMKHRPTPVLMLSQLTKQGAELTLQALELGAVDFVDKSSRGIMDLFDLESTIISKVKAIAGSTPVMIASPHRVILPAGTRNLVDVVGIGSSTGGPLALQIILPKFPGDINFTILVVQHMPPGFTGPLAKRLDALCDIRVKEAEEGDRLSPGTAFIAPAGRHMAVKDLFGEASLGLSPDPADAMHKPSVDVLFESLSKHFGSRAIGVILTGMGSDGVQGLTAMKERGAFTIAQDESTSAIFGMPRVAIEKDVVDRVLPLTEIAGDILSRAQS